MKYTIYRFIEGVSLNGKEYLLDDDNEVMLFDTKQEACAFIGYKYEKDLTRIGYFLDLEEGLGVCL